jgi:hypothetical protein
LKWRKSEIENSDKVFWSFKRPELTLVVLTKQILSESGNVIITENLISQRPLLADFLDDNKINTDEKIRCCREISRPIVYYITGKYKKIAGKITVERLTKIILQGFEDWLKEFVPKLDYKVILKELKPTIKKLGYDFLVKKLKIIRAPSKKNNSSLIERIKEQIRQSIAKHKADEYKRGGHERIHENFIKKKIMETKVNGKILAEHLGERFVNKFRVEINRDFEGNIEIVKLRLILNNGTSKVVSTKYDDSRGDRKFEIMINKLIEQI